MPARAPLTVQLEDTTSPCNNNGVTLTPIVGGDPICIAFPMADGAETPAITVQEPGALWVESPKVLRYDSPGNFGTVGRTGQKFSYVYVPNVFAPESADPENAQFRPAFFLQGWRCWNINWMCMIAGEIRYSGRRTGRRMGWA